MYSYRREGSETRSMLEVAVLNVLPNLLLNIERKRL
jgi:hypothetical protein